MNPFLRRSLGEQTFYARDDLVFSRKTLSDVDAVFVIKNARHAFLHKVDGFAGMADGLENFVFFEVQEMGDGEKLRLAVFAEDLKVVEVTQ